MSYEKLSSDEIWRGSIAAVSIGRYQHDDGTVVTREVIDHPGAVVVLAHDGRVLYLVSQPREAVAEDSLLELPAGKLDPGEEPIESAKRELAEEVGKGAREWKLIKRFYASPGYSNEVFYLYLGTDLYDRQADANEHERIEIVTIPLDKIQDVLKASKDAKTIVGLYWLTGELGAKPDGS